MNYLLILALREYGSFYRESCLVPCPDNAAEMINLNQVADDLSQRLISIFEKNESGDRKVFSDQSIYSEDPHFKDLMLFYEYFHGDTGRGVGASHQTGWTGVIAGLIQDISERKTASGKVPLVKTKTFMTA
jgi:hypothetical protein